MNKAMRWTARLMVLLLAAAQTACGFHWKGQGALPAELAEVYLDYRASSYEVIQSRLEESLRTNLERRGARVVSNASARGRLTVYELDEDTRVLSVGPTGKAIEYEIETTVEFDYSVDGQQRVPRGKLTVLRDYSFDETRVLAKETEREGLQREMQEELANLMLLRIEALLPTVQPGPAPAAEPAG